MPTEPKKIKIEQIIQTHDRLIREYGGESGILNEGELHFIVGWVNDNLRKSIFWRAAILMRGIVCGHPFVDGNKRTAYEVVDSYLRVHGYKITADKQETLNFILNLARYGSDLENIVEWLKKNTRKFK
mgnify:CR=1 FL=1